MSKILIILLLALALKAETEVQLRCRFHDQIEYSCLAMGLDNSDESSSFSSEVLGKHVEGKSNFDVSRLIVKEQKELSVIPKQISNIFPNLMHIDVKGSPVTKVSKEVFEGLDNLEHLKLTDSSIEELPQNAFSDLKNLKNLTIERAKLKNFHFKTFENNVNMELLALGHNQISFIHEKLLVNLINLREIHLEFNAIEELREQTFAKNTKLVVVNLKGNKLKMVGTEILKNMKNIKLFDFSDNVCVNSAGDDVEEITKIFHDSCLPPDFKRFEDEIKVFKDSEVKFKSDLKSCKDGEEAAVALREELDSKIETLEGEKATLDSDLSTCTSQRESCAADLGKSEIDRKSFEDQLKETAKNFTISEKKERSSLESLNLINEYVKNASAELSICKGSVETLKESLKLRDTLIQLEADRAMSELLKEFEKLENENRRLRNNENLLTKSLKFEAISEESKQLFSASKCDEKLEKCLNKLPVCSSFFINCDFSLLQVYDTDRGEMYTCRSRHVSACSAGMRLQSVEGTHASQRSNYDVNVLEIKDSYFVLNNEIFEHLPNIEKLQLTNAGLGSLQPILKHSRLRALEIEDNKIPEIEENSFTEVKNLESLLLVNNQIETLTENCFNGLEVLQELSLRDNNIAELPVGIFKDLVKLTHLDLKNNKLRSLDGGLLKYNPKLEVLQLEGNRGLRTIGSDLLDYSKPRMVQFGGTCVGNIDEIKAVKQSIRENCK